VVAQLCISLLGNPMILQNDVSLKIKRKKARGLVYFLAAHKNPVSRDELHYIFWPGQDLSAAQHNLNVHLSEIRKQMPHIIISDNSYIQIAQDIKIDVRFFDSCFSKEELEEKTLRKALSLYRGDFLNGFNINDASDFDNWKFAQQEHYKLLFIKGLRVLHKSKIRFFEN
jgi:DNA-binding SARP family transcriptional activator